MERKINTITFSDLVDSAIQIYKHSNIENFALDLGISKSTLNRWRKGANVRDINAAARDILSLLHESALKAPLDLNYDDFLLILKRKGYVFPDTFSAEKESFENMFMNLVGYAKHNFPDTIQSTPQHSEQTSSKNFSDAYTAVFEIDNRDDFFKYIEQNGKKGDCLDIAFHSGNAYLHNGKCVAQLTSWLEHGLTVRILINVGEHAKEVVDNMQQKNLYNPSLEVEYELWKSRMSYYPGQLLVRATKLPILHRTFIFCSNSNENCGAARVVYYHYGEYIWDEFISHYYQRSTMEYKILQKEFNHLWDNCSIDE